MNFLYNKYKSKDSINSLYMSQGTLQSEEYEQNNSSPQVLNHNPTHSKITKTTINYSNILQLNDLIVTLKIHMYVSNGIMEIYYIFGNIIY